MGGGSGGGGGGGERERWCHVKFHAASRGWRVALNFDSPVNGVCHVESGKYYRVVFFLYFFGLWLCLACQS